MITQQLYIREDRLDAFKMRIRKVPSARFAHEPLMESGQYYVKVYFDHWKDKEIMDSLICQWHEEDYPTPKVISLYSKFKTLIKSIIPWYS